MKTIIIGITGPTGSGKSFVCSVFSEKNCKIIDADKLARYVVNEDEQCRNKLAQNFGSDIFGQNGVLNRKLLAQRAFCSSEKERLLNSVTHPSIIKRSVELIQNYKNQGVELILIDAPLLFEAEMDKMCDCTIVVLADKNLRIQRIMKRDNIDEDMANLRINAQPNDEFYSSKADYVIYNSGDMAEFSTQTKKVVEKIIYYRK